MGKVHHLTPNELHRNRLWSQGYSDGYNHNFASSDPSDIYQRAHEQGVLDREEDEAAIASGTFDLLNEEERVLVYGHEERASDYREA